MFDSQVNSGFTTTENINISGHFTEISLLHASSNGYSEIYKAKRYGRWHVLKCLTQEAKANPMYQTLLEKEFTISYPLNHPNVLRTLGMEQVENLGWCIVQEYVDGEILQAMTPNQMEQLCDALIYIHHLGITHRDLKPENILVTHDTNSVVLLDFGLADKADFAVLKSAAGTTGYIAPEQLVEGIINPQVDIFALGVILSQQKQWKRIAKRCMQVNPKKRYLSVEEIKKHIVQPSPWIKRSIIALLLILLVITGLGVQLHHQNAVLFAQQQSIESTDSKNAALQQQLDDYQGQIDSLTNKYQQDVKELKKQLLEANDKNQELSRKIREFEPHINRMFHLGPDSQR